MMKPFSHILNILSFIVRHYNGVFFSAKMQNCHFHISHHKMATNGPTVINLHFMNPEHIQQMLRSFILFSIIQILSYWPLNITTCPKM